MKKSWMDTAVSLNNRKIPDEIKKETPPTPMTADEKNSISHRGKAIEALADKLKDER